VHTIFFDDLRRNHQQPSGTKYPPTLFDFSHDELASAQKQSLMESLLPPADLDKLATGTTATMDPPLPAATTVVTAPGPTTLIINDQYEPNTTEANAAESEDDPDADSDP